MAGLSDYAAQNQLNWEAGVAAVPGPSIDTRAITRFLALFSVAPTSDAGTGGTEVSGGGYARVQVAGQLQAAAAGGPFAGTTITLSAPAPAWLLALGANGSGCNVFDATTGQQVGTVSSISGTTVTLTGTATHSVANSDLLQFSAFPQASASSGSEPSTTPANVSNSAVVNFAQATGSWAAGATIPAWGLYDAVTGGNLITFDYLGNFKWTPFSCSSASPGVLTTDASADVPANGSSVVVTAKFGGTLPTTGGSWAGILTSAGSSTNTFNLGVNTTSVGGGQFRQVTQYGPIGNGVNVNFPASNIVITAA